MSQPTRVPIRAGQATDSMIRPILEAPGPMLSASYTASNGDDSLSSPAYRRRRPITELDTGIWPYGRPPMAMSSVTETRSRGTETSGGRSRHRFASERRQGHVTISLVQQTPPCRTGVMAGRFHRVNLRLGVPRGGVSPRPQILQPGTRPCLLRGNTWLLRPCFGLDC